MQNYHYKNEKRETKARNEHFNRLMREEGDYVVRYNRRGEPVCRLFFYMSDYRAPHHKNDRCPHSHYKAGEKASRKHGRNRFRTGKKQ